MRYAGICGSDIQTFRGTQPFTTYPRVPGHEFSAEIVEIHAAGGDSAGFQVGDVVTGVPYFQDGTCYSCRRGLINACEHNETMGVHRDGAFQELLVMPLDRLHRADGVDPRDLALVEPFSIGYHAVLRADVGPSDRVLVLGAGAIGLLTMLSALTRGAQVWIADVVPSRLELADRLGAAGTIDLREDAADGRRRVRDRRRRLRRGLRGDRTAGLLPGCDRGRGHRRPPGADRQRHRRGHFQPVLLIKKELTVLGSRNSRGVFPTLIELLRSGAVDVSPIRTLIVPFAEARGALEAAAAGSTHEVKVLLDVAATHPPMTRPVISPVPRPVTPRGSPAVPRSSRPPRLRPHPPL